MVHNICYRSSEAVPRHNSTSLSFETGSRQDFTPIYSEAVRRQYIHDPPSLANLHTPLKTSFDSSRVADRSRFQLFAYLNSFFFDQFHYIYIQFVFNLDRSRLLCLLP
ncbi:hypothetical protein L2E82_40364 [Cichorium intybus]|uniref:Uncharacterized protein n=1 Tax=Cichorium intybus TaxID=13427 RepID=A0ACB9ALR5_CICIN|nr:hypothetical protein L2E82_40364 [Cichorium intybus]